MTPHLFFESQTGGLYPKTKEAHNLKKKCLSYKSSRFFTILVCFSFWSWEGSHPTVGVRQQFLGSWREEQNIPPETWLRRNSFAQPDQHLFLCAGTTTVIEIKLSYKTAVIHVRTSTAHKYLSHITQPLPWDDSGSVGRYLFIRVFSIRHTMTNAAANSSAATHRAAAAPRVYTNNTPLHTRYIQIRRTAAV